MKTCSGPSHLLEKNHYHPFLFSILIPFHESMRIPLHFHVYKTGYPLESKITKDRFYEQRYMVRQNAY